MRYLQKIAILMMVSYTIISCTNPKKELLKSISTLEQEMATAQNMDQNKGYQMIDLYQEYTSQYPEDTASANFLYKAAEIAMNLQLGKIAIDYYNQIIDNYSDFNKIPECVFLKAFIYENQLNDLKNAEIFYSLFLKEYPNHPLAKDAEASIKYLGKSPEELVQLFQEMNAE